MKPTLMCLALLVACTAQPPPDAPAIECPTCPVCASCPPDPEPVIQPVEKTCPACPEPVAEPEATDWHCVHLDRPNRNPTAFCYASARICEYNRQELIASKLGKVGACFTQREAFCFTITDAPTMTQQRMCSPTMENCERVRDHMAKNKPNPTDKVSMCALTPNIEEFPFHDEEPSARLLLPAARVP